MADPVGGPIGHPGDDHAAVAVPDEDHVAQILVVQHGDDVVDVQVEVDVGAQQVRPFTQAGQGRRVHLVPRRPQEPGDPLVAPAAVPTAVHQDVRRHLCPLPRSADAPDDDGTAPRAAARATHAVPGHDEDPAPPDSFAP